MRVSERVVADLLARLFGRRNLLEMDLEPLLEELNADPVIDLPLSLTEVGFVPESVQVVPGTVMPKYKSTLSQYLLQDEGRFHIIKDSQLPGQDGLFFCVATTETGGGFPDFVAGLTSKMLVPKLLIGTELKYGYTIVSVPISAFKL